MNKHPHDEVIRAWLDGKDIQMKLGAEWIPVNNVDWYAAMSATPRFAKKETYRIKPEKKVLRYRVGLFQGIDAKYVHAIFEKNERDAELNRNFIRWLGDEQVVEID